MTLLRQIPQTVLGASEVVYIVSVGPSRLDVEIVVVQTGATPIHVEHLPD